MKLSRKMSPMLLAVVAVVVGCSMIGAALTVLVSNGPAASTATVTVDKALTLSKSTVNINGLGNWGQDYPYLDDAVTPAVGSTYDISITARASDSLPNVQYKFKVTNQAGALIDASDLVVKEYNTNISAGHWVQLDLESYGDYVIGTFQVDATHYSDSVIAGHSDHFEFMVQFLSTGTYVFDWYAEASSSPTAV